jgi:hypothetical protein
MTHTKCNNPVFFIRVKTSVHPDNAEGLFNAVQICRLLADDGVKLMTEITLLASKVIPQVTSLRVAVK